MPAVIKDSFQLTGPQIGEAVYLFVEAASDNEPLQTIAYELLSYLIRHGQVTDLLETLCESRPLDEGLRQFVSRTQGEPGAMRAGEQVGAWRTAIETVTANAQADPIFHRTVGMAKGRFELVRAELDRLARYKALHDCLHNLQLEMSVINRTARAFLSEPAAAQELNAHVDQLARQARRARRKTEGLLTQADELTWVDEFDQALESARKAVRESTAATLTDAVEALGGLLPHAVRINGEMISAARRLAPGMEELAKTLSDLEPPMPEDGAPHDGVVDQLEAGAGALDGLTPQLAGLADIHDIWQRIETALAAAHAVPDGPPAQRVPRWPQVKKLLNRVCPTGSVTNTDSDPVALANDWEKATDPIVAENLFGALHAAARHMFKDVDDQLLDLADQLTGTVDLLDVLLQVI